MDGEQLASNVTAGQSSEEQQVATENTRTEKRKDYIRWEDYFMALALLAAKRSKDPVAQVGACVVTKEKKIVDIGYNGMPIGCSDDEFPWGKDTPSDLDSKHMYVCHAELNVILNKSSAAVKDCIMYVTRFPCADCTKMIIQSGIKEVIYFSNEKAHQPTVRASKRMLDAVSIKFRQFIPGRDNIVIDFTGQTPSPTY